MSETSNFNFCPKCGALARNGICQSCGYQNPDAVQTPPVRPEDPSGRDQTQAGKEQNLHVPSGPEQNPGGYPGEDMLQGRPESQGAYIPGQAGNQGTCAPGQPGNQNTYAPGQPGSQGTCAPGQPGNQGTCAPGQPGSQGAYIPGQPGNQGTCAPGQPGNQSAYAPGWPGSQGAYTQGRPEGQGPSAQAQQQNQGTYGQTQPNAYANYGGNMYPNYMPAPAPAKKGSKAPLIVVLVLLALLLVIGIAFAVFYVYGNSENPFEGYHWSIPGESAVSGETASREEPEVSVSGSETAVPGPESSIAGSDLDRPQKDEEGLASGKYYTEIYSDIRYDLDYQVEMQYGVFEPEEYPYAYVNVSYPRITGNVPNIEYLNEVLEYEYTYFVDYFEENLREYMEEESYYVCYSEAFVTYMDEKVMSVVFKEQVEMDAYGLINLYCVNINMEDGVIMNNTELLDMDTDFAIDFRNREILENGDELLTDYSDQEILNMLQDPDYLIIFYTPMGMEVGLNMMDVIIYVTYRDYERFISGF